MISNAEITCTYPKYDILHDCDDSLNIGNPLVTVTPESVKEFNCVLLTMAKFLYLAQTLVRYISKRDGEYKKDDGTYLVSGMFGTDIEICDMTLKVPKFGKLGSKSTVKPYVG